MNENVKVFVLHFGFLGLRRSIHPARKAQLALLLTKEVTMSIKYSDFADVCWEKSANVFLKWTGANEHAIELEEGKQLPYGPIYSLELIEFKTFKIYIKTHLANDFIRISKSIVGAPIFFVRKPNGSLCLCINYQRLNNLTIKNWYLLSLISESLDWLGQAK